jgi:hypothetical protein
VDPLQHQEVVGAERDAAATLGVALAAQEVVARRHHRLAAEQTRDVVVQQRELERLERLEIVLAALVPRGRSRST